MNVYFLTKNNCDTSNKYICTLFYLQFDDLTTNLQKTYTVVSIPVVIFSYFFGFIYTF